MATHIVYSNAPQDSTTIYKNRFATAQAKYASGYYDEAIALFNQCKWYYKERNGRRYLHSMHYQALCNFKKGDLASANLLSFLGSDESDRLKDNLMKAYFWQAQGLVSFSDQKYGNAIRELETIVSTIEANVDLENTTLTKFYIGKSYWLLRQQEKAIPYFKAVAATFNKHHYAHPDTREAFEHLIAYYKDNPDAQLEYINQLQQADQFMAGKYPYLFPKARQQHYRIQLQQMERKARQESLLKWIVIGLSLILLSINGFIYYRKRKAGSPVFDESDADANLQENDMVLDTDFSTAFAESVIKKLETFEADKKYLDSADIKQLFKISDRTLYRWRQNETIPFTKMGGKLVYPKQAVLGILQSRLDNKYDPIHIKAHQKVN
jgi:hypothetical protein